MPESAYMDATRFRTATVLRPTAWATSAGEAGSGMFLANESVRPGVRVRAEDEEPREGPSELVLLGARAGAFEVSLFALFSLSLSLFLSLSICLGTRTRESRATRW